MSTKMTTGVVRLSYANIWDPKAAQDGGEPKYSASLIIPKSDTETVAKIKAAIQSAYEEDQAKIKGNGKSVPSLAALKTPLRDGDVDREGDAAYAGCWFMNATSKNPPKVVDKHIQPILDRSEIYSGVYAKVSVNFYGFNTNGNRGIACGLGNVQKIRDGEPLGGGSSPESDFVDEGEDDFMN